MQFRKQMPQQPKPLKQKPTSKHGKDTFHCTTRTPAIKHHFSFSVVGTPLDLYRNVVVVIGNIIVSPSLCGQFQCFFPWLALQVTCISSFCLIGLKRQFLFLRSSYNTWSSTNSNKFSLGDATNISLECKREKKQSIPVSRVQWGGGSM
jgi:hypothetical protein